MAAEHRQQSKRTAPAWCGHHAENFTFVGSDRGGDGEATFYTLIESAKLNRLDPEAYVAADPIISRSDCRFCHSRERRLATVLAFVRSRVLQLQEPWSNTHEQLGDRMPAGGSSIFTDVDGYQANLRDIMDLLVPEPRLFHARLAWVELSHLGLLRAAETSPRVAYVTLPAELAFVTFSTNREVTADLRWRCTAVRRDHVAWRRRPPASADNGRFLMGIHLAVAGDADDVRQDYCQPEPKLAPRSPASATACKRPGFPAAPACTGWSHGRQGTGSVWP